MCPKESSGNRRKKIAQIRKDPIVGSWVIISTERSRRPTDLAHAKSVKRSESGAFCPFCEGNEYATPPEIFAYRDAASSPNAPGWQVRVVANKFPALHVEGELERRGVGMFDMMNGIGAHEVIIESPHHQKTFTEFDLVHLDKVLSAFKYRSLDLKKDQRFKYILLFKNYGSEAAASLDHSHSQLIATPVTPMRIKEELKGSKSYYNYKDRCIFCDIITQEIESQARVIELTEYFVALTPFASRFPFEIWILPRHHCPDFDRTSDGEMMDLALILRSTMRRLTKALDNPPYNFLFHTAPNRLPHRGYWHTIEKDYHWHIEIIPRVVKQGGFEWGTGFYINPTLPEEAAGCLREAGHEN